MAEEDRAYVAWEQSQVMSNLNEALAAATAEQVATAILNIFSDADIEAIVRRISIPRRSP